MKERIATVAFAVVVAASGHTAAQVSQPKAYTADWVMSGTPMPMNMHISKDEDNPRCTPSAAETLVQPFGPSRRQQRLRPGSQCAPSWILPR